MNLTLCLTHDCNLACAYCYAGAKRRDAMTWDVAQRAIDFAFGPDDAKRQLGFFGGEPLMQWNLLRRALEYAESIDTPEGVTLLKTLTTNGTLLDDDKLAWLAERDVFLAVSIDGDRAMHDLTRPLRGGGSSFDACVAGLRRALAVLPQTEVIVVPDPRNVWRLADGVKHLADETGAIRISINPNFYVEWPQASLDAWRREFEKLGAFYIERFRSGRPLYLNFIDGKVITRLKDGFEACDRCSFGEDEIAVAPSGRIYPCERLVGEDTNDEVCIGTVHEGFDVDKRLALMARRGNTNDDCLECRLKHRCMNWCGCINYATTGSIDRVDGVVCFHERMAIAIADRVANTLYEEGNRAFLEQFYYETLDGDETARGG